MKNMRRDFKNREELINYLQEQFPKATQPQNISQTKGGRSEAEKKLKKINPKQYTKTRNYFNGQVSYLSPYIRHGVISLTEARDHALNISKNADDAEKFINELGWRDYWQRLYNQIGDGVWDDREDYKTGYATRQYSDELSQDIINGETGLKCIDAFTMQLHQTGYLHNHARMYFASYIIHHRKIKWQLGARWFLQHLLDGDPASNNLSWQWVASTFSHKPYYFNRENLEKFTDGVYCRDCPLYKNCPFEGTYEDIETRLFPNMKYTQSSKQPTEQKMNTIVWIHGDNLSPYNPALLAEKDAPALFVWDEALLKQYQLSLKRIVFIYECLLELPVIIRKGDVVEEIITFANEYQATRIVTAQSPSPRFRQICQSILKELPKGSQLEVYKERPFVEITGELDLKRFSRYWESVKYKALHPK